MLAQTLPTTQPYAFASHPAFLYYAVPIGVGLVAASGPLLTTAITWWHQSRATRLQTYLTAFKTAQDAGLTNESDTEWARGIVADLHQDRRKKLFHTFVEIGASFAFVLLIGGLGLMLGAQVLDLPMPLRKIFGLLPIFSGLVFSVVVVAVIQFVAIRINMMAWDFLFFVARSALLKCRDALLRIKLARLVKEVTRQRTVKRELTAERDRLVKHGEWQDTEIARLEAILAERKAEQSRLEGESLRLNAQRHSLQAELDELESQHHGSDKRSDPPAVS